MSPTTNKGKIDVSIVIPLFNEEENVEELCQELQTVIAQCPQVFEVIFIDDGSGDNTYARLEQLFGRYPGIRVIKFKMNFHKAAAYSAGFQAVRGDIVITMDGDLQDNPAEIPQFLEKINQGYEIVSGWRYNRQASREKTIASRIFNKVVAYLTGIDLHDFNCPFKAYRREAIKNLKIYGELHRYIPALAYNKGYKVAEIKVVNRPRKHGYSKYGIERWWRGFFDALTVLLISKYGEKPLHFFGSMGLILFLIGLGIDVFVVLRKLFFGVLFSQSMGLLTLGIIIWSAAFNFFSVGLVLEFILGRMINPNEQYLVEKVLEN